jgi:hypothetical protein
VDGDRRRRLAVNETLARDANEVAERMAAAWRDPEEPIPFRCECAAASCGGTVHLTREEYGAVRARGTRFVVVDGHQLDELEEVVGWVREYALVEKRGPAVAVAEATDPRAGD